MNRRTRISLARRLFAVARPALGVALLCWTASGCQTREAPRVELARQAWDRGEYVQAAHAYESLLADDGDPASPEERCAARFELANTYYLNLRDYPAAARHYSQLLDAAGESSRSDLALQSRRRLAEVQALLKRPREAISEYETLLLLLPDHAERREWRFAVAELYYAEGDYDQAATEFHRVVEGAPYDALAEKTYQRLGGINHHLRKNYDDAIRAYRILSEKTLDDELRRNAKFQTSDCLVQLLRYEEAAETLQSLSPTSEAERAEIRNRIRTIRKRRQTLTPSVEIDWNRKR
jgi:tetratricopeptide (TPR) repeat protein